ncbi:MAG: hypothetical protein ACTS6G_02695 [Candidatus Hodgkinia cicadicola]
MVALNEIPVLHWRVRPAEIAYWGNALRLLKLQRRANQSVTYLTAEAISRGKNVVSAEERGNDTFEL